MLPSAKASSSFFCSCPTLWLMHHGGEYTLQNHYLLIPNFRYLRSFTRAPFAFSHIHTALLRSIRVPTAFVMDHPDEKTANKDEEPSPSPGPDVVLPTTRPDDIPQSPAATATPQETPRQDMEQEQERSVQEPSSMQTQSDKSPCSSLDAPARDEDGSPDDSGEQTPTATEDIVTLEHLEDFPRPPADLVVTEVVQVDSQDTSSSDSTHSVPDSAAGLDSPMPPNSTAPSSTRTSLTDTPMVASSSSSSSKPIGILRSATLPRSASTTSMSAVTFAPLPPTEPRRRASHMQLGVAARSRMLRARRMRFVDPETGEAYVQVVDAAMADHQLQHGHPHYVYPGEEAAADGDPYRTTRRQPRSPYAPGAGGGVWCPEPGSGAPEEEGNPEEDALIALGKMVKGGAKALWRKVSKSQKARDVAAAGADDGEGEKGRRRPSVRRSASAPAGLNGMHEEAEAEEDLEGEAGEEGTLRIEFKEPRHCFEGASPAPPPLVPQSILRPATPLAEPEKVAPTPARGAADGEVGRVWEEAVDTDITKRFEAVARAEKEKERTKTRLVAKLAKVGKRKESKEKLKERTL